MPIFEYLCKDCGHEFEDIVFGRETRPGCPKCGSQNTDKLMSRCRAKVGGRDSGGQETEAASSSSGGCSGCTSGNCSSCGA
ncbi:MAG: zinc ribbon domain-containing protein [Desulfovibrionaceae bacterium]|nr:zinc ribbon domain-containing protein [Desulfovibrionaceae bacterium]